MTLTQSLTDKRKAWDVIFNDPELSVDTLRHRAISGTVCQQSLRSVCWKIFLGYLPNSQVSTWPALLLKERQRYTDLRRKYIEEPAERMSGRKKDDEPEDLSSNNPLALNDHNPWQQYFEDTEMRKVILQDVERTFPDVDFFRQEKIQQHLTDILFIYCKINREVSYRQGMHELLAPFYWVLQNDSVDVSSLEDETPLDSTMNVMLQVLDCQFVEHDVYILFERLMENGKAWYEFNDEVTAPKRKQSANENNKHKTELISDNIPKQRENTRLNPIVMTCHRIHHQYLRTVDPTLYNHLESFGIEPQLYGLRWIRLLFGREFDFYELLKLWDAIFAQDPDLEIVNYICVVILLRIRDQLLQKDYAECLSLLMRPLPTQFILKPASIVEQAKLLKENLSSDTALQILQQMDLRSGKEPRVTLEEANNTNSSSPYEYTRNNHGNRVRSSSSATTSSTLTPPHLLQHKSSSQGFESFAKNMMKNPQVRDLNRAIAGVMGTVQKNVSAFGNRYQQQQEFSSEFPSGIDRIVNNKSISSTRPSSYHPQSTSKTDRHLSSMPTAATVVESSRHTLPVPQQRQMGEMLAKCINLLEDEMFPPTTSMPSLTSSSTEEGNSKMSKLNNSDESEGDKSSCSASTEDAPEKESNDNKHQYSERSENKETQTEQQQRRDANLVMALVGLKHIRDILNGKQTHFDPTLLDIKDNASGDANNDELRRRSSTKDEWQFIDHPTIPSANSETGSRSASKNALSSLQKTPSPFASPSRQLTSTADKDDVTTSPISTTPVTYVPKNPTPTKQPIKYRIEDLLSDPDLSNDDQQSNSSTTNKLKWMLTDDDKKPESARSSSSGSSNKALFNDFTNNENEKHYDMNASSILKKKKSHSFILSRKHSSNSDKSAKSNNSTGREGDDVKKSSDDKKSTLDPLDAHNVDTKKFYDDGY